MKTELKNLSLFWSNSILMTTQYFARKSQHSSKSDDVTKYYDVTDSFDMCKAFLVLWTLWVPGFTIPYIG